MLSLFFSCHMAALHIEADGGSGCDAAHGTTAARVTVDRTIEATMTDGLRTKPAAVLPGVTVEDGETLNCIFFCHNVLILPTN